MKRALPLLLSLCLLALPQTVFGQDRYQRCLEQAHSEPEAGLAEAEDWLEETDSGAARHCAAAALAELGRYAEAASHLRVVADAVEAERKPEVLSELAWLWLLEGRAERAEAVLGEALALAPDDLELRIDRAIARAELERWQEAITDLDRAQELAPERVDILILRAEAQRHAGAPGRAHADLDEALRLQPENAEALMHRGILRYEMEQIEGAKKDWRRAAELDPNGRAGRIAARNLEQLEEEPEEQ